MNGTHHAFEFLKLKTLEETPAMIPVFGSDRFLQGLVVRHLVRLLGGGELESENSEDDFGTVKFSGEHVSLADVRDELASHSLFSSGPQLVLLQDADKFVKSHRDSLEDLLARPYERSCLILGLATWPANTRLYKQIEKAALQIDVGPPMSKRGKSKSRDDKKIAQWIIDRAAVEYRLKLSQPAARQMLELLEDDFGRMDQELCKISLIVENSASIDPSQVAEIVGGWKANSIWEVVDQAVDGELSQAMLLLNRLLQSGEHPLALYGQLAWSLRRFGSAFEVYMKANREGKSVVLRDALKTAGFRNWSGEIENAERRMKRLGRIRTSRIHRWLLETDLALKGSHSTESRARWALEWLLARLAA